jgi:hypothetical protein
VAQRSADTARPLLFSAITQHAPRTAACGRGCRPPRSRSDGGRPPPPAVRGCCVGDICQHRRERRWNLGYVQPCTVGRGGRVVREAGEAGHPQPKKGAHRRHERHLLRPGHGHRPIEPLEPLVLAEALCGGGAGPREIVNLSVRQGDQPALAREQMSSPSPPAPHAYIAAAGHHPQTAGDVRLHQAQNDRSGRCAQHTDRQTARTPAGR